MKNYLSGAGTNQIEAFDFGLFGATCILNPFLQEHHTSKTQSPEFEYPISHYNAATPVSLSFFQIKILQTTTKWGPSLSHTNLI